MNLGYIVLLPIPGKDYPFGYLLAALFLCAAIVLFVLSIFMKDKPDEFEDEETYTKSRRRKSGKDDFDDYEDSDNSYKSDFDKYSPSSDSSLNSLVAEAADMKSPAATSKEKVPDETMTFERFSSSKPAASKIEEVPVVKNNIIDEKEIADSDEEFIPDFEDDDVKEYGNDSAVNYSDDTSEDNSDDFEEIPDDFEEISEESDEPEDNNIKDSVADVYFKNKSESVNSYVKSDSNGSEKAAQTAPTAESPKTEAPTAEAPKTEAPKTEAPKERTAPKAKKSFADEVRRMIEEEERNNKNK